MQQLVLSFNNRAEILELPVPLQEWSVDNPHNSYNFTTVETGDVKAIGKKKLSYLTINSEFPTEYRPYMFNKDFPSPQQCIQTITKWKLSNKPIRVIILGTDVNLAMAIENFNYGRNEGDGSGDYTFSLELEEYTFLNMERSQRPENEIEEDEYLKERPKEEKEETDRTHIVKAGDTMWDMADKYLNDGSRWKEIANLNDMTDGFDLRVGETIKIPDKETR